MKPMRWREPPDHPSRNTAGADLVMAGNIIARVRECEGGWYFYGCRSNSVHDRGHCFKDEDTAKTEARAHCRRYFREAKS